MMQKNFQGQETIRYVDHLRVPTRDKDRLNFAQENQDEQEEEWGVQILMGTEDHGEQRPW